MQSRISFACDPKGSVQGQFCFWLVDLCRTEVEGAPVISLLWAAVLACAAEGMHITACCVASTELQAARLLAKTVV